MGEKRHIMRVYLSESENIRQAEINLTVCAVSNCILTCNLAESKAVLKMCISKRCHEVTGFLSWIETYCISCVVQQRSRVTDLSFLVGYDDSWLGEIRLVKSIKGIHSLFEGICKITQSKLNCQRLQYEIYFILCSYEIKSSERKKIAKKQRYSSFEYCEMEPLKKKI